MWVGARITDAWRGGGPDAFIEYLPSLIGSMSPIQFHSCFISYSRKDEEFAERLHKELQGKGVRCWYAPHDLPIGARIRPVIDSSIHEYDKLLLLLSEHSVNSQWVEHEVETALRREREQNATVLFPVRLDDAAFSMKADWPALITNTRNIGDFRKWKNRRLFDASLGRLLRDLKAKASTALAADATDAGCRMACRSTARRSAFAAGAREARPHHRSSAESGLKPRVSTF
jgi:TIR domain